VLTDNGAVVAREAFCELRHNIICYSRFGEIGLALLSRPNQLTNQ
jgi:hypothetical protein